MASQCQRAAMDGRLGIGNCWLGGGEAPAEFAQSSCGCPWIPGSAQGQAGQWGWSSLGQWQVSLPWQGWHWLGFKVLPTQTILGFWDCYKCTVVLALRTFHHCYGWMVMLVFFMFINVRKAAPRFCNVMLENG